MVHFDKLREKLRHSLNQDITHMKLYESRHAKERAQGKLKAAVKTQLISSLEAQECQHAINMQLLIDAGEFADPDTGHIECRDFTYKTFCEYYSNIFKEVCSDCLANAKSAIECVPDAQTLLGLDEMKETHMLCLAEAIVVARCAEALKLFTTERCKHCESRADSIHKEFKQAYKKRKELLCKPITP